MAGNGRRNADDRLVLELAAGKTVADAATAAGIGERTAFRRLGDAAFRSRVAVARAVALERALSKLAESSCRAVETLVALLDADADSVRLGAARSILDAGIKLRDSVELQERVRNLEQNLEERHDDSVPNHTPRTAGRGTRLRTK